MLFEIPTLSPLADLSAGSDHSDECRECLCNCRPTAGDAARHQQPQIPVLDHSYRPASLRPLSFCAADLIRTRSPQNATRYCFELGFRLQWRCVVKPHGPIIFVNSQTDRSSPEGNSSTCPLGLSSFCFRISFQILQPGRSKEISVFSVRQSRTSKACTRN